MRARDAIMLLVIGVAIGTGCIFAIDRFAPGSIGQSLARAERASLDARASANRLRDGLGNLVIDLDGALVEAGKSGDVIARLRARERVYADVARRLRDLAKASEQGSEEAQP